jgi:hypothetical protein
MGGSGRGAATRATKRRGEPWFAVPAWLGPHKKDVAWVDALGGTIRPYFSPSEASASRLDVAPLASFCSRSRLFQCNPMQP